jgi:hypothetical protein
VQIRSKVKNGGGAPGGWVAELVMSVGATASSNSSISAPPDKPRRAPPSTVFALLHDGRSAAAGCIVLLLVLVAVHREVSVEDRLWRRIEVTLDLQLACRAVSPLRQPIRHEHFLTALAVPRPLKTGRPHGRIHNQPFSLASSTASLRVRAPSLLRISETLLRTVPSLSHKRLATSAVANPSAHAPRISCSLLESGLVPARRARAASSGSTTF